MNPIHFLTHFLGKKSRCILKHNKFIDAVFSSITAINWHKSKRNIRVLKTMQEIKSARILLTVLRHVLWRFYVAYSIYYTAPGVRSFFILWREIRNRLTAKQTYTYMDAIFPAFKYKVYPLPTLAPLSTRPLTRVHKSLAVLDTEQKVSTTVLHSVSTNGLGIGSLLGIQDHRSTKRSQQHSPYLFFFLSNWS